MKIEYEATFRIDLGKAIPAVNELLESVNTTLAECGVEDKITCHAPFPSKMVVSANRELTEEEQHKMKTILEAEIIAALPGYDIRLVKFCRKSGNVQQSVVQ
jgi:hypothetical protein